MEERKKYPNMWGTIDFTPKSHQGMFFNITSKPVGIMHSSRPMFTRIRATNIKPMNIAPKQQQPISYRRVEYEEEKVIDDEYPTPPQEENPDITQVLQDYYSSPDGQYRAQQIPQKFPEYNSNPAHAEGATMFMLEGLVAFYKKQGKEIPTTLYEDLYAGIYEGLQ